MEQDNKEQKTLNGDQMVKINSNNKIESPKPSTRKADSPKSITSQTESTMSSDDSQENLKFTGTNSFNKLYHLLNDYEADDEHDTEDEALIENISETDSDSESYDNEDDDSSENEQDFMNTEFYEESTDESKRDSNDNEGIIHDDDSINESNDEYSTDCCMSYDKEDESKKDVFLKYFLNENNVTVIENLKDKRKLKSQTSSSEDSSVSD